MDKEKITSKQAISIIVLFICGSTLMFDAAQGAKEDIWLALIIAFIAVIIVSMVYGRILTLFPGKNLFRICMIIFGKWVGSIFCVLYAFFSIHLATLVLHDYVEFMSIVGLSDTPEVISMLCMVFLIMWVMKEGITTLGRWCEFFIVVVLLLILITIPLFIPHMNINNLRPFLYKGPSSIVKPSIDAFTFPFAEPVVFMCLFNNFKNEKSPYSIYRRGLAIGAVIVFVSAVTHMLVLGPEEMTRLYFPPYKAFRLIDIKGALTRIEIVIAAGFLIGGFIKITVCLLVCCKGICEIVSINNYKVIVTPICIFSIIIASSDFSSIMDLLEWTMAVWSPWALFYQVTLPVIILIGAEIKVRKGSRKIRTN